MIRIHLQRRPAVPALNPEFSAQLPVALARTEFPRPRVTKAEFLPERDTGADSFNAIVVRLTEAPFRIQLLRTPGGLEREVECAHQPVALLLAPHILAGFVCRFGQLGRIGE